MGEGKQRNITIKALQDSSAPDGVVFKMFDGDAETERLVFDKHADGMKKADYHKLLFTLENGQGVNLRFPSDRDRAMWVTKGTENDLPDCPSSSAHHAHMQPKKVLPGRMQLEAHNHNPERCLYKFALNFVDGGDPQESKLICFDPITENRNGGFD